MSKTRLTCENCGFDEELGGKALKGRLGEDGTVACSACGAKVTLPKDTKAAKQKNAKAPKPAKKSRYAGIDDMTGLDDVIEEPDSLQDDPKDQAVSAKKAPIEPEVVFFDATEVEDVTEESAAQGEEAQDESKGADNAHGASGRAGQAAGVAKEKLKDTLRHGRENPLFIAEILDKIFRGIANNAHGRFEGAAAASVRIGHYTLLATSALALIFGVLISLRSLSLGPLLAGVTLAALLLFAQYLALRGFELLQGYIDKNPSRLPGTALTDILSAFSALFAILSLLCGLILTVRYLSPVWLGLPALGVIGGYFAAAAFLECDSRLNVSFDENLPAGKVVMELASTALKAVVALAPFMFGLGSALMALCMIWPAASMLLFSLDGINTASFFLQESGLLFCAFYPIFAYLTILLGEFIIYLVRSIVDRKH